jgi:hypothetical protein
MVGCRLSDGGEIEKREMLVDGEEQRNDQT